GNPAMLRGGHDGDRVAVLMCQILRRLSASLWGHCGCIASIGCCDSTGVARNPTRAGPGCSILGEPEMGRVICLALNGAVACALLASCAQPPPPAQALPAGPTPGEVADYARAQAWCRSGLASGNGHVVMRATNTFQLIARE